MSLFNKNYPLLLNGNDSIESSPEYYHKHPDSMTISAPTFIPTSPTESVPSFKIKYKTEVINLLLNTV